MTDKEKVRVQLILDKQLVEAVDALVAEVDGNRTNFVAVCIEHGIHDWEFMKKFGATPPRIKKLALVLKRLGILKPSGDGGWATSANRG